MRSITTQELPPRKRWGFLEVATLAYMARSGAFSHSDVGAALSRSRRSVEAKVHRMRRKFATVTVSAMATMLLDSRSIWRTL